MDIFTYSEEDFLLHSSTDLPQSKLDIKLKTTWDNGQQQGYFRYKLDKLETRILPGKYGFVAQLNVKRAQERRKPQDIQSVCQPFNPDVFNFTKVRNEEVLFRLYPSWSSNPDDKHLMIINASPLEYCNSLLVPSSNSGLPQVLTEVGIRLAVECVLLSSSRRMKIGFNSLCAYASVNHQHCHIYYLQEPLYLETVEVNHLAGPCYTLEGKWPASGFVFELTEGDVEQLVKNVHKLSDLLVSSNTAYNMCITRGNTLRQSNGHRDTVRVFLWGRKSSFGAKDDFAFNIACCELSGHLPMKNEEAFHNITEDEVVRVLHDTSHSIFQEIKPKVNQLFNI